MGKRVSEKFIIQNQERKNEKIKRKIEVFKLYDSGYSIKDIHNSLNISEKTIFIYLKERRIETGKQNNSSQRKYKNGRSNLNNQERKEEKVKRMSEALNLYNVGCSFENICEILNLSHKTIFYYLQEEKKQQWISEKHICRNPDCTHKNTPMIIKYGKGIYCSKECSNIKEIIKWEKVQQWVNEKHICRNTFCPLDGEPMTEKYGHGIYCSKKCSIVYSSRFKDEYKIPRRTQFLSDEEKIEFAEKIQRYKPIKEKYELILAKQNKTSFEEYFIEITEQLAKDVDEVFDLLFENYENFIMKMTWNIKSKLRTNLPFNDLFQNACTGFINALWKADPEKIYGLMNFAYLHIFDEVSKFVRENKYLIQLPDNAHLYLYYIRKAKDKYEYERVHRDDISFIGEMDYIIDYIKNDIPKSYRKELTADYIVLLLERGNKELSTEIFYEDSNDSCNNNYFEYNQYKKQFYNTSVGSYKQRSIYSCSDLDDFIYIDEILDSLNEFERNVIAYEFNFPPTMEYKDFCDTYKVGDRKIKNQSIKIIEKLRLKFHLIDLEEVN